MTFPTVVGIGSVVNFKVSGNDRKVGQYGLRLYSTTDSPPKLVGIRALDQPNGLTPTVATAFSAQIQLKPLGTYSLVVVQPDGKLLPTSIPGLAGPAMVTLVNPAPRITSLMSKLQAGNANSPGITVDGTGFLPASQGFWNGSPRTTKYTSPTVLGITLTAADLAQVGSGQITVVNPTPGGGTSNPVTTLITQDNVGIRTVSGASTSPQSTAFASWGGKGPFTPGSVNAQAIGAGTITTGVYPSKAMPELPSYGPEGLWSDINVSSGNSFSSVVVVNCNTQHGRIAYWWNGQHWLAVSNQSWDPATGCITMTLSASSSPSIAQLNGTPFEIWGANDNTNPPTCVGSDFSAEHGGRLPDSPTELNLWGAHAYAPFYDNTHQNSTGLYYTGSNPGLDASGSWKCGPSLANATWFERDDGLRLTLYDVYWDITIAGATPDDYDDGTGVICESSCPKEIAAYERAHAGNTLTQISSDPGQYLTEAGPKTPDDMRAELRAAGYLEWSWASDAQIIGAYAVHTTHVVTLPPTGGTQPGNGAPVAYNLTHGSATTSGALSYAYIGGSGFASPGSLNATAFGGASMWAFTPPTLPTPLTFPMLAATSTCTFRELPQMGQSLFQTATPRALAACIGGTAATGSPWRTSGMTPRLSV